MLPSPRPWLPSDHSPNTLSVYITSFFLHRPARTYKGSRPGLGSHEESKSGPDSAVMHVCWVWKRVSRPVRQTARLRCRPGLPLNEMLIGIEKPFVYCGRGSLWLRGLGTLRTSWDAIWTSPCSSYISNEISIINPSYNLLTRYHLSCRVQVHDLLNF